MTPHDRSLVTKVIVLEAHAREHPFLNINAMCGRAGTIWPDFDFVHWAGAAGDQLLLESMFDRGWIREFPRSSVDWAGSTTDAGREALTLFRARLVEVGALTFLEEP